MKNRYLRSGDVVQITLLSRQHPGFVVLIDAEDLPLVSSYTWYLHKSLYAYTKVYVGQRNGHSVSRTIYLHRLVMNATSSLFVDHKNRHRLDCRKENLRFATRQQHSCNQTKRPGCTSQYLGVHWFSKKRRWIAGIKINYRRKSLGQFICEQDAARAYNEAARRYHGEFASLNPV